MSHPASHSFGEKIPHHFLPGKVRPRTPWTFRNLAVEVTLKRDVLQMTERNGPTKTPPQAVDVCGAGCWLLKNVKSDQSAGDFALEIVTGSFDLRSQG